MARSVKPNFLPELWMMIGCRGLTAQREESRLGEESLEDGSDDSEYGDMGLASGDTPKTSTIRVKCCLLRHRTSICQ